MTTPILATYQALEPIVMPLDTSETVIVPGAKKVWNKELDAITISNVTGSAATFSIYLHEVGVAGAVGNAVAVDVDIAANTIYQLPIGPLRLPPNWELTGLCSSGDAVNVMVTGRFLPNVPDRLKASI